MELFTLYALGGVLINRILIHFMLQLISYLGYKAYTQLSYFILTFRLMVLIQFLLKVFGFVCTIITLDLFIF